MYKKKYSHLRPSTFFPRNYLYGKELEWGKGFHLLFYPFQHYLKLFLLLCILHTILIFLPPSGPPSIFHGLQIEKGKGERAQIKTCSKVTDGFH